MLKRLLAIVMMIVASLSTVVKADNAVADDSHVPTVYLVNDTIVDGINDWPVNGAVRNWNRNNHLRIVIVDSCENLKKCSLVREWIYPEDYKAAGTMDLATDQINLNATMNLPRKARKMAVCHEIGHFLGLMRHTDPLTYGCMREYLMPTPMPHAGEKNRIKAARKLMRNGW